MEETCKTCESYSLFKNLVSLGIEENEAFHLAFQKIAEEFLGDMDSFQDDIDFDFDESEELFLEEFIDAMDKGDSFESGYEAGYKEGIKDLSELVNVYAKNVTED